MSIIFILFMGFLTALALLVVCWRINIQRIVGYPVATDITATSMFIIMMAGTLTGMAIAIVAGLLFSGAIGIIRRIKGYERFNLKTRAWEYYPAQHA